MTKTRASANTLGLSDVCNLLFHRSKHLLNGLNATEDLRVCLTRIINFCCNCVSMCRCEPGQGLLGPWPSAKHNFTVILIGIFISSQLCWKVVMVFMYIKRAFASFTVHHSFYLRVCSSQFNFGFNRPVMPWYSEQNENGYAIRNKTRHGSRWSIFSTEGAETWKAMGKKHHMLVTQNHRAVAILKLTAHI